ncbi:MAG: HIT domain-containing protein [Planctomycetota bacterium]|jgi:histidine triad (HIT) family protein|nr:HIT domain-containing protein [Planctomycetota bacterium]
MESCVFCRIARGEIPAEVVYEDAGNLVFRDIKPAAPVHLLAIPRRHVARLADCSGKDADLLAALFLAVNRAAAAEKLRDFRLIVNNGAGAGQTVFHLHAHILAGGNMSEKLL